MSDSHSPHDPTAARADRAAEVAAATDADVALEGSVAVDTAAGARVVTPPPAPEENRWSRALREIATGNAIISVLAVILALLVGAIMIAATDENVQATSAYFFARPGDTLAAIWESVSGAYASFFQGAIYNFRRPEFATGIKPLTETLTFATPLIAAGLGVALAFRVGMFNIGGRGQMLVAAAAAGWVAFSFDLPWGVHMVIALVAGVVAGAIWAGIAGVLKARTGAHEVIVTIMLNFVVLALLGYLTSTRLHVPETLHTRAIRSGALPRVADVLPAFHGSAANATLVLAIVTAITLGWFLFRTRLGFEVRAVGLQPRAAEYAGANVARITWQALTLSGAIAGLGGLNFVIGYKHYYEEGFATGAGFLGIAVALVGRSHPLGIVVAALLFATLSQGGLAVNALVPKQMVDVLQAVVILAVATSVPEVRRLLRGAMRSAER